MMKYREFVLQPSIEMVDYFHIRTKKHIDYVKEFAIKIEREFPEYKGLTEQVGEQVGEHDRSKYEESEYLPYVYLTWEYKLKRDGIDYKSPVDTTAASEHHVKSNKHHVEYWSEQIENLINRDDRDKPLEEMIDGTRMPSMYIAEMCADWMAMSKELGSSPIDWADKNVNIRWKFTDEQREKIYSILNFIWNKES